ncbi:sodium:solute symporter family protein [Bacteriovoracaceae bacterium]|nr:sodium:solute symporter family protein [Bacteriovoracaceae bacterium]
MFIDILIVVLYFIGMIFIGLFFFKKNKDLDDYYLGGRNISSLHVGLSIVATDVGGGFSIGLGGLGFTIGISGSWLLFTGLLGAWISAIILIPRIKKIEEIQKMYTFPQIFEHYFDKKVAILAAFITTIGYLGFTSSQLLAGAKLASTSFNFFSFNQSLIIMGAIAIIYTTFGGLKAVIYTDTIQWIILLFGLAFFGLPMAHQAVGGYQSLKNHLPPNHLSFSNIDFIQLINWSITIIPIWFIGMTLYQRIYACNDVKTARKAWFIAGLFEFPIMAFIGVALGVYARVAYQMGLLSSLGFPPTSTIDSEIAVPLMLKTCLPVGIMGLVLASYFSAILSTADSCLMASSGSMTNDILRPKSKNNLRFSQISTLVLGLIALILATFFKQVLSLMLYSYSFMVSGLFVPLIACIFFNSRNSKAAFYSMIIGGSTTIIFSNIPLPFGIDSNLIGILSSFLVFLFISKLK